MGDEERVESLSTGWRTLLIAGAIAGAVPFMISMSSSKTTVINGVASSTYRDWVAVGGGAAAIVFALAAIASLARSKRMKEIGIGAIVVALGGYQVARGFGVFEPKPSSSSGIQITSGPPPMTPPPIANSPETCANGDECDTLAHRLKETDPKGALVARIRSCTEFKHKYACEEAAQIYASDLAGPKDLKKALEMADKACDLGNGDSCTNAGVEYFQGKIVDKDLERGLKMMAKGCDDGNLIGCKNLGLIYKDGLEGAPVDLTKAFEYAARSCGDGRFDASSASDAASGCEVAGELALEGKGTKKDGPRAIQFFTTGCERSADRCFDLARAHELGLGGLKKDPKTAREIYKRGCDGGALGACNNLASLMLDGLGGPKDKDGAKKLFKQACDGGFEHSCKFAK